VCETSHNGTRRRFTVHITNEFGQDLNNVPGFPATGDAMRDQTIYFPVPARPGPHAPGDNSADARNESRLLRTLIAPGVPSTSSNTNLRGDPDIGGLSDLSLESVFFNSASGRSELEGIFDLVLQTIGPNLGVLVPDLYADTNGNSQLDDGDRLYSVVDLRTWIVNPPDTAPLSTLSIVNGRVPGLPGMMFSTTPFTFNSGTGSFDGTPYTGDGVVLSTHGIFGNQVPSPATGLPALLFLLRRRPRRRA
jgi:hypothetical protein